MSAQAQELAALRERVESIADRLEVIDDRLAAVEAPWTPPTLEQQHMEFQARIRAAQRREQSR